MATVTSVLRKFLYFNGLSALSVGVISRARGGKPNRVRPMTVTSRNSAGERAMALLKELILEEEREQAAWKELVIEEERERAANQAVLRETELSKDDARTAPVVAPTEVKMLILEEGEHVANQAVLGETELSKDEARTATGAPPTEAEVAKPEEPSPGGDASGAKENKYSCPSEKTPVNVGDATARNEKIRSEDDIFAE